MGFFTGFVIFLISVIVYWVIARMRRFDSMKGTNIPGPKPNFIIGNFLEIMDNNAPKLIEWSKKYPGIFSYWFGANPIIVVTDIELIKLIQVKDFHNFAMRRHWYLRGGLEADEKTELSMIGDQISTKRWKEQRSLITTAFTTSKLKDTVPLVEDAIAEMMVILEQNLEKEVNIYDMFQGLTMDTIGRSAFGVMTNAQRDPTEPLFLAAKHIFEPIFSEPRHYLTMISAMFPEFQAIAERIRAFQWDVIRAFGAAPQGIVISTVKNIIKSRRKNITDPTNPWSRVDLLQKMIEADESGVKMTDDEIAANGMLFFDAGYETTSTLLGFLAHVLVNNQDIQDKMREEIKEYVANNNDIDYNAFKELPYMDGVIHETLRMYPPISMFITREPLVDYKYDKYTLPKGFSVLIPPFILHKDVSYWEEPEKFIPERFIGPEKRKNLSSPYYQPFGFGPRICVGLRFALLETKIAMSRILLKYKLVPGDKTETDLSVRYKPVSITPKDGVFVKVVHA